MLLVYFSLEPLDSIVSRVYLDAVKAVAAILILVLMGCGHSAPTTTKRVVVSVVSSNLNLITIYAVHPINDAAKFQLGDVGPRGSNVFLLPQRLPFSLDMGVRIMARAEVLKTPFITEVLYIQDFDKIDLNVASSLQNSSFFLR